jgi:hypothetical protein
MVFDHVNGKRDIILIEISEKSAKKSLNSYTCPGRHSYSV